MINRDFMSRLNMFLSLILLFISIIVPFNIWITILLGLNILRLVIFHKSLGKDNMSKFHQIMHLVWDSFILLVMVLNYLV